MKPLATVGNLIEVIPQDELQYWRNVDCGYIFIDDQTPFQFRVERELFSGGLFFGLSGPVEAGPDRYLSLICNILIRIDNSDWKKSTECWANFKVGPTIVKKNDDYIESKHSNIPFYSHPEGTCIEGYPRISRFGEVKVIYKLDAKSH